MSNIDEKTIAGLLGRIDAIKNELSQLEDEIKALQVDAGEPPVILDEAKDLSEAVEPPELAPVDSTSVPEEEEPIDIAPVDDTPIDISISDVEDMPADAVEPSEPSGSTPLTNHGSTPLSSRSLSEVEGPAPEPRKAILDTAKADTAVMDVMAEKQAWRTDRPGMPVKNIISAISLNDRVFLINTLFGEDPMLFQETISKFNAMGSLSEALAYIDEKHPDWDMNSDAVYRLMMAVRRKLS